MACDSENKTYYLKRGDTARSIEVVLLDPNEDPVDLTSASSIKFIMRKKEIRGGSSAPKVSEAAVVVNAAAGLVRYDWAEADVDTVGIYLAEWEVTWTLGGPTDTYPSHGYAEVIIAQDLNENE
jgi:hypothetical protein